ncbi:MAG: hypothetical protein V3V08_08655 [Nannocystaceae bacterium]
MEPSTIERRSLGEDRWSNARVQPLRLDSAFQRARRRVGVPVEVVEERPALELELPDPFVDPPAQARERDAGEAAEEPERGIALIDFYI